MNYRIVNRVPGRVRIKLAAHIPDKDVDALESAIAADPSVSRVTVYPRIGSVAVSYEDASERSVLEHLSSISRDDIEAARGAHAVALAPRTRSIMMDLAGLVGSYALRRWLLPPALNAPFALWNFRRFLKAGVASLKQGRLDVPVLDAAAIGISFAKGDPKTAGSTMLLLDVGETLEEYTKARSEHELIRALADAPQAARVVRGDEELTVPASELASGDVVVARTGMAIVADGVVERGTAMVNQSALTGEPLAVERSEGDDVFAGTAVEDGEVFIRVRAGAGESKLRSIVRLVEQSEALKARAEERRERLANKIVPWNFLLAGIVAATTRSLVKTSAALMVDYSCALKLTGSIAVLAAMSQSAQEGFTVKGSKHFEAIAEADTIVFDKTGTLTAATPRVARVLALDPGWDEDEVLRVSACLEEHFPHPVARAVVNAAAERGLEHRERHAEVTYLVAHGIASRLDGNRIVIGSRHFVTEDEGISIDPAAEKRIDEEMEGLSPLYLADGDRLVGVIGIEDPLKPGVAEAISELRELGLEHVVMLTGDNERTAARIAAQAGISEYRADLLPEDKHAYVEELRDQGRHVIMVGDGVNDSPALSVADVGIAMGTGTAIAREVADVTLNEGGLDAIVRLRRLSASLMRRLDTSFVQTIAINSALLAGGIAGVITPQASSLAHNASTIALAAHGTRAY